MAGGSFARLKLQATVCHREHRQQQLEGYLHLLRYSELSRSGEEAMVYVEESALGHQMSAFVSEDLEYLFR